ncbi:hypothetical protein PVV74_17420 [Roseovarius sp. SK2]|uniref:hypothetical protein n=1 Tax=Roseovarius TaxID=74030 RepID=UPI00237B44FA|nr:hypothetical protein [Roseovarius sp. SK2]MDD9727243.1 hypothetical protein [Roseovarius sp. SK2]
MNNYAPFVRIGLRYLVGAGLMGSAAIGEQLAADPDLVFAISAVLGAAVEAFYAHAKMRGGKT